MAYATSLFIEAMNLGSLWVPSMMVSSVTMTTLSLILIFDHFLDLRVMVFLYLSKIMVSRKATMWCLDGVNGVIPNSTKGLHPSMIVPLDETRVSGSIGSFWVLLDPNIPWSYPPLIFFLVLLSHSRLPFVLFPLLLYLTSLILDVINLSFR